MYDPATKLPKSYVGSSDNLGRRLSDSYNHAMYYDSRVQKTAQSYANFRSWNNSMVEEDESGVSTPPLWRSSSPTRSPPHRQNIDYRCLSPNSKAQAIARGQQELMEMVSRMPESCYELTLKDLVEHQDQQAAVVEPKQDSSGKAEETKKKKKKTKNSNHKPQIKRSGSIDNGGFLLKMVLPISLRSNKKKNKKKNDSSTNHNSKVSPKPMVSPDASGNNKVVDKEWWKKRSGSSESESGGSTLNSGSTKSSRSSSASSSRSSGCRSTRSNSSRRHRRSGCLDFILHRKGKASQ